MMSSLLTLEIGEDAESFLAWVGEQIRPWGGTLVGDASSGRFCLAISIGQVGGEYRLQGRQLTIRVTRKPFLLSTVELKTQLMHLLRQRDRQDIGSGVAILPDEA
jgi:hypothetical protein